MAYTFGAALDHPLAVHRFEYRDSMFEKYDTLPAPLSMNPLTIYPHTNWRGDYHMGTFSTGETGRCTRVPANEEDHEVIPGTPTGGTNVIVYRQYCLAAVKWPGKHVWLDHSMRSAPPGNPDLWIGSLVFNKRDLTGNIYMRNRYYDPQAGRFTQEDPIGLAGGLNAYGFAAGDPVTYSDPYGLCEKRKDEAADRECPPKVVKVTVSSSGSGSFRSSLTVTTEYAPLSQQQVDHVVDGKRQQERIGDGITGALVSVALARLGANTGTSTAVGLGSAVLGSGSDWAYMPRVGDQVTATVTAGYGSSTNSQSFAVRRADGTTLSLSGDPWKP